MTKQASWMDDVMASLSPLARFAAEAFMEGFNKSFEPEDDDDQFDPEPSDEVDVIAYLQEKVKRLERERDHWKAAAESGESIALHTQLEEAWATVRRLTRTIQAVYSAYEGLKEALHTSHFDE